MGKTIQIGSEVSLAGPQPLKYGAKVTISVDDTVTNVVPANPDRLGLFFSNSATGKDCWIALEGEDPVAEKGILIAKGDTFIVNSSLPITGEIRAICKNGQNTEITFQEAELL